MSNHSSAAGRRPYEIPLLVVAVAAAGFNLRTAITSLPPLFPDLQTRLNLSSATLSLLAGEPDGVEQFSRKLPRPPTRLRHHVLPKGAAPGMRRKGGKRRRSLVYRRRKGTRLLQDKRR